MEDDVTALGIIRFGAKSGDLRTEPGLKTQILSPASKQWSKPQKAIRGPREIWREKRGEPWVPLKLKTWRKEIVKTKTKVNELKRDQ